MQDAQTLRRNFLWNTFGQLTYMLCQFLCGILVVRLAGEQVSGVYNTALTATGIFLSIASYGMYSFQVSDIRGKYGASTYIRSRVWTCALAVALCIGFVAVSALTGENPYSAQQSVAYCCSWATAWWNPLPISTTPSTSAAGGWTSWARPMRCAAR